MTPVFTVTIPPKGDEQGGQPERRIGRILKSKVLGRRRVTLVVRQEVYRTMRLPIIICRADSPDCETDFVTCLSHEHVIANGLPSEAIIGVLLRPLESTEAITPDVFARNRIFVDFMQGVIARRGPQLPGLLADAARQGNGLVVVVDQRTHKPEHGAPPEDIIGVFKVQDGQVVPGSYTPSPNHQILSSRGFFQLNEDLQSCLLEELSALRS